MVFISQFPCVRNMGAAYLSSASGSLMKEVIVSKLGRRSCRVLIVARGSESKMTHSRGCWQETQSLIKRISPQSYLSVLMLGLVAFPAGSDLRQRTRRKPHCFL